MPWYLIKFVPLTILIFIPVMKKISETRKKVLLGLALKRREIILDQCEIILESKI